MMHTHRAFWTAVLALGLAQTACADGAANSEGPEALADLELPDATPTETTPGALDGGALDASAPFRVSLDMNGTGCPVGSTRTDISPDGHRLQVDFSGYEANIDAATPDLTITKDCRLSIRLHSTEPRTFALESMQFAGHALLEEGVSAVFSARSYFAGAPVAPLTPRVMRKGPFDDDFTLGEAVASDDRIWTPCGIDRNVNIASTLQLRNGSPKRAGHVQVASLPQHLAVQLTSRPCARPPAAAPISAGNR